MQHFILPHHQLTHHIMTHHTMTIHPVYKRSCDYKMEAWQRWKCKIGELPIYCVISLVLLQLFSKWILVLYLATYHGEIIMKLMPFVYFAESIVSCCTNLRTLPYRKLTLSSKGCDHTVFQGKIPGPNWVLYFCTTTADPKQKSIMHLEILPFDLSPYIPMHHYLFAPHNLSHCKGQVAPFGQHAYTELKSSTKPMTDK